MSCEVEAGAAVGAGFARRRVSLEVEAGAAVGAGFARRRVSLEVEPPAPAEIPLQSFDVAVQDWQQYPCTSELRPVHPLAASAGQLLYWSTQPCKGEFFAT